ncbi:GntR family transcriptional regulator [Cryobacterium arcticum]|uniref:GntR family transcriptional regulator n=1 Tax=Cryobacterium arcticum TaxID=670052 RepID=A0A317ZPS1_9MICO|nr:GntR family transcriptional regulator [Cryobacterium arcticum]PXA67119.1 GntR family transcriptional regulator [Cryobacterium arcticum]
MTVLQGRITSRPGIPLRVEVYDRIAGAIRAGALPPESLLPSESELGEAMEVSRTVVREALLLLEEDGLLRSRRGIGRVVSVAQPAAGFERLRPMEQILSNRFHDLSVSRTEVTLQRESASFIAEGLGIPSTASSLFIESVLTSNGDPVALVQEHLPAGENLHAFGTRVQRLVENIDRERTCLGSLAAELGPTFGIGRSELAAGTPGVVRAKLLKIRPTSPVLIVTQTVRLGSRPFYLAKVVLRPEAGPLEISHSAGRGHLSA